MEPISVIVTALALGATEGLKSTATQAIRDGYSGLKALILRKYDDRGAVGQAVKSVEASPDSKGQQEMLRKELTTAGSDSDQEVVDRAVALLKALEDIAPGVTGGLVGQINAAGGKVIVVGRDVGEIKM